MGDGQTFRSDCFAIVFVRLLHAACNLNRSRIYGLLRKCIELVMNAENN